MALQPFPLRLGPLLLTLYHIAHKAGVPIVLAGLDFGRKQITFSKPFLPTGNMDADLQYIIHYFADKEGKIPEYGLQHLDQKAPN